jgi:Tfp pilus assembly protein PilO
MLGANAMRPQGAAMNPAEFLNLRSEVIVLRELVKCLISQLPDDEYVTEVLESAMKNAVAHTPEFTQERLALQRAIQTVGPLQVRRKPD